MTTASPLRPVADDATIWFRGAQPELRSDADVISGLDDRPLLYLAEKGRYIAVGREVVRMLDLFDGTRTGDQIVDELHSNHPRDEVTARVARVAMDLRQAGALTEAPTQLDGRRGFAKFMLKEHLYRIPLTRRLGDLLEPFVAPTRRIPGRFLAGAWLTLAAAGVALGVLAIVVGRSWTPPTHWWLVYVLLFTQIAFHETSHALVCQYLRVPVREAGIGLMLYLMPVGYVDRTDSYRVPGRGSRAFLSLAGPVNDQIWFGAAGVVALTVPGEVGNLAFSLLFFQLLLTVMNLNPLTPSDGYHALSAAVGQVNVRGQALSYLTHLVLRIPLTPAMAAASPGRRRLYVGYGLGCIGFVLLLAWGVTRTVLRVVGVMS